MADGRAVASDAGGPQFESITRQNVHRTIICCQLYWKDENKERYKQRKKEAVTRSVTRKNRQMSTKKVVQKLFHYKNDRIWHLYKNCLRM